MAERKKYIEVNVPIIASTMKVLGTPENLNGKTIKLDLTRNLRGKGLVATFRIFNKEGKLLAVPKKLEIVKSYISRMTRKRTDYVEDSFVARCKDFRGIIKPLLITRKRVSRVVRKNLRNTAKEFLLDYVKEKDYNDVCKDLLDGTLQKTLLPKLKKVYPLSFCDIRIFETKEIEKIDLEKVISKENQFPEESLEKDQEEEGSEKPLGDKEESEENIEESEDD